MAADDRPSDRASALLAGLSSEQRDAVTTTAPQLCIIAGAGSGKTRVLTRRVAWQATAGNLDPRRVLVLTFTRRAASELRSRLRSLGMRDPVAAGTFHAAALALLRRYWDHCDRPHLELLANRFSLLTKTNPRLDVATIAALNTEISWARARLITPERYAEAATDARRRPPRNAEFTASVYEAYQLAKNTRRLIDFDDVLALCHSVLSRQQAFADTQRWFYQHLFVDEFQDVNPLQFAVLRAWLGAESSLTLVGDPDQAVYGFNGADPDLIGHVGRHLPGIAVVHLRTNFRSTPEVVGAAARVLNSEPQPVVRPAGEAPTVTVAEAAEEAPMLARAVRARRLDGASWRDQAVLARTNAQLPALQEALTEFGIPTRSRDTPLLRHPEIVELLNRRHSATALSTVLRDEQMRLRNDHPDAAPDAVVETFMSLASDHLTLEPTATLGEFAASLRTDDRVAEAVDAVELCTFHAAKGLEWPIVHLVGLEDGLVPVAFARSRAALAEERRLLYVAATRARRELHVMWCSSRIIADKRVERSPSPWLEAFVSDPSAEQVPTGPPSEVVELLQRLQDSRSTPGPARRQAEILRELQQWRGATARAARIKPSAVLNDRILSRIAEQEPSSISALSALIGNSKAHRFGPRLLEIVHRLDT